MTRPSPIQVRAENVPCIPADPWGAFRADRLEFDSFGNAIEREERWHDTVDYPRPHGAREELRAILVADLASSASLPVDHHVAYHARMVQAVRDVVRRTGI